MCVRVYVCGVCMCVLSKCVLVCMCVVCMCVVCEYVCVCDDCGRFFWSTRPFTL